MKIPHALIDLINLPHWDGVHCSQLIGPAVYNLVNKHIVLLFGFLFTTGSGLFFKSAEERFDNLIVDTADDLLSVADDLIQSIYDVVIERKGRLFIS